MITCCSIPSFSLRVALRGRQDLAGRPVALAPPPGGRDAVGPCTAAAQAAGVRPGMRLSEALATCPALALVEDDPIAVDERWEQLLERLEDAGFAVEPAEPGCAYFRTEGVERLAGGLGAALQRALDAVGGEWEPRLGAASRRFTALAAASVAPACRAVVVDDGEADLFLEPLPLDLLPLPHDRRRELSDLGIRRLGELARLPGPSVADRFGGDVAAAWQLVRGESDVRIAPRTPPAELAESLVFPETVANAFTLERGLRVLLDRLLARPERAGRAPRQVTLSARLSGGSSWRRAVTLREPTSDPERLRAALLPRLAELPAPAVELRLELGALADSTGAQLELLPGRSNRLRERLREGLGQVRAAAGHDAVCTVMEVSPWSRIPESRAILVPRDD